MIVVTCLRVALAVSLLGLSLSSVAWGASDRAINAWIAKGTLYPLNETHMLFQGEQKGTLFIRHEEKKSVLFHAGRVRCPLSVDIDLKKDTGAAQGMCSITDQNGDKAFAKWSCSGAQGNCHGKFTFTGGTGQFQGITGESDLKIRVDLFDPQVGPGLDPVEQHASGYMLIPEFNYTLR